MNNITIKEGSIFDSLYNKDVQTIVNTVNCEGFMGKGIALGYKFFYPEEMFEKYKEHCKDGYMEIGKLSIYKDSEGKLPWILHFPTKIGFRYPSKLGYIELGLQKFVATYKEKGITSIAFPMLGTTNGGLNRDTVLKIMQHYLSQCDIPVIIYIYASDKPDLYCEEFKSKWSALSPKEKKNYVGTRPRISILDEAVNNNEIKSLLDLLNLKGIGEKTLIACFREVLAHQTIPSLFE